eukprot:3337445-Pleurochrysis_carterae.AAC.12
MFVYALLFLKYCVSFVCTLRDAKSDEGWTCRDGALGRQVTTRHVKKARNVSRKVNKSVKGGVQKMG